MDSLLLSPSLDDDYFEFLSLMVVWLVGFYGIPTLVALTIQFNISHLFAQS